MPVLRLNFTAIQRARARLAEQRGRQRSTSAEHQRSQAELARMRRSGADARTLARQERRVAKLAADARAADAAARAALTEIRGLSEQLRRGRDPAVLVQALSAAYPVMLMPVSVQTRYDDATSKLMIRIYPDTLHGYTHEPGLTPNEVDEGKRYWTQRFAVPADAQSPWLQIARVFGPARAAYVVRTTTPTNVDAIGPDARAGVRRRGDPARGHAGSAGLRAGAAGSLRRNRHAQRGRDLPKVGRRGRRPARPLAAVRPAAGREPGHIRSVRRRSGVAGRLRRRRSGRHGDHDHPGRPEGRYADDPWRATASSCSASTGRRRRRRRPNSVAALLDNHLHSAGLKFVAQGTPTNNTSTSRAGFAANGADVVAALEPSQADQTAAQVADELASAGARLQLLLGVPKPAVGPGGEPVAGFDAGLVPGADLAEGASSGHMLNALWNATLGYTLRFFWNPIDTAQTLIEDAAIDQLRAYGMRFLRPGGPLSALRVGKTPYGILPITARGFVPKANSPIERELFEALSWFRTHWDLAASSVPTLRDPSAESLHQVLAMQPWALAKRFWQVVGPAAVKNYPDIEPFAAWQGLFLHLLVESLLEKQPFSTKAPFLATCAVRPKPHSLDAVPWVQRDPDHPKQEVPPDRPLATQLHRRRCGSCSRSRPTRSADRWSRCRMPSRCWRRCWRSPPTRRCCQSGRALFRDHVAKRPNLSAAVKLQAKRLRPAEYVGVDVATQIGDQFDVGHANAVLGLRLEGTTASSTVEGFIGSHFGQAVLNWPEQLKNIASFNESLAFLQDRTVGELGHAFKTTLDLYSHRLDAWITSLATKRLDELREKAPQGLHIGAFGIVEDLLPDSVRPRRPVSRQLRLRARAVAAAGGDRSDPAQRPSRQPAGRRRARSTSTCARTASSARSGCSRGSPAASRWRRCSATASSAPCATARCSQHILELRRAFPLLPAGRNAGDEAKEAIAARNVIDGVRLVAEYREKGIGHIAASVLPLVLAASERATIGKIIDELSRPAGRRVGPAARRERVPGCGRQHGRRRRRDGRTRQAGAPARNARRRHAAQHARLHAARGRRDAVDEPRPVGGRGRRRPRGASRAAPERMARVARSATPAGYVFGAQHLRRRLRCRRIRRRSSRGPTRA